MNDSIRNLAKWVAFTTLAAIIAITIFYAGIPVFGPINDLLNALIGVLSAALAYAFSKQFKNQWILWSVIVGAGLIAGNSVLVAFGKLNWMIGGFYTALGYGLIGIWLWVINRRAGFLAPVSRLGTIAGVSMSVFGLPLGLLLILEVINVTSPLAWVAMAATLVGYLIYPIWCYKVSKL